MRDKITSLLLIFTILLSVVMIIYVIVTPAQGEKFTEFYILGPGGMAYDYLTSLGVGEEGTVTVGVVNHEYEPVDYTLRIQLNNRTLRVKELRLKHNETFMDDFSFTPLRTGDTKLEFLLYREDVDEPYRSLHLWVKVN